MSAVRLHAPGAPPVIHRNEFFIDMEDASQAASRRALPVPVRRLLIGSSAGVMSSAAFWVTRSSGPGTIIVLLAAMIGAIVALADLPSDRKATLDRVLTGAALGIPFWAVVNVILAPTITSGSPAWTAPGMRAVFPALVGWVLFGASLALLTQAFSGLVERLAIRPPDAAAAEEVSLARPSTRILILGGGFAGVATAKCLERAFGADRDVDLTLVSETNALLFTPMLAEVAASSLEPTHISSPLRTSLRRTQVVRGSVRAVDLAARTVTVGVGVSDGSGRDARFGFDHCVLALGSTSNYFGQRNVEREAFDFKSLLDAIRIRNHVIGMFERADRESDADRRAPLLTFVVAGGGFAGVELAGALNDFARGIAVDYPRLRPDEIRVILVHARDRILPELSPSLAAYAFERISVRGVQFRLNTHVADARPGVVVLDSGEELPARTLVWTAGTVPNLLLRTLPVARDKRGAVIVDGTLAVPERTGLWAVGDCAAVTDARSGQLCPPTAQFALREAQLLAKNIHAAIRGGVLRSFHFESLGALCVVGHQIACAELRLPFVRGATVRFSGLLAWAAWRTIYLTKLPGLERKVRVLFDWTIELFFPRDTVQTLELD
jgi:NADH:ubiquinone reductase (H+-translocating)